MLNLKDCEVRSIIERIKKENGFFPEEGCNVELLNELKKEGWILLLPRETSDIPIRVIPSKRFREKYKLHYNN